MAFELATETRDDSYHKVKRTTMGRSQAEVLKALKERGNSTNNEIAMHLGWPINSVTGRVYELREKEMVASAGKRACTVSGETCMAWRVSES